MLKKFKVLIRHRSSFIRHRLLAKTVNEVATLKKQEEAMMLEALGLKSQQRRSSGKTLEQHELDELCKRGDIADEERGIFNQPTAGPPCYSITFNFTLI